MAARGDNPFGKPVEISEEPAAASRPVPSLNAWQPFTAAGVAAFAGARLLRLLAAEFVTALLCVLILIWFLQVTWFPVVLQAIRALPEGGAIEAGELITTRITPDPLAQNGFLGIAVDVRQLSGPDARPDFYLKFNRRNVEICSFFGSVPVDYPIHRSFYFGRTELEAAWGAWMPFLLGSLAVVVVVGLMAMWSVLAMLYAPLVRLFGSLQDKQVSLSSSWKLASAALLPGAAFWGLATLFYGLQMIGLLFYGVLVLLHFIVPWVYLVLAPRVLPALVERRPPNPFK